MGHTGKLIGAGREKLGLQELDAIFSELWRTTGTLGKNSKLWRKGLPAAFIPALP